MRAFINAVGNKDSLGSDRASEIRGLVGFGGKSVTSHNLDKLEPLGINGPVLVYVNPSHKSAYDDFARNNSGLPVRIVPYSGPSDSLLVYCAALAEHADGDDILLMADDNLFDFSLEPMVEKFRSVNDNVIAVRDIGQICSEDEEPAMNFGKCSFDERGKVTGASYSFAPQTFMDSHRVLLDLHIVHRERIPYFLDLGSRGESGLPQAVHTWWRDFYVWKASKGFWADIGKPSLRRKAEEYFGKVHSSV
jgi:NDP-sugar pyrophosphorylase family protein